MALSSDKTAYVWEHVSPRWTRVLDMPRFIATCAWLGCRWRWIFKTCKDVYLFNPTEIRL